MTRCNKNENNLKSTAYNQTGENYFQQLIAYNSMRLHLRRLLLAKSVVDARNKNYTSKPNRLQGVSNQNKFPIFKETVANSFPNQLMCRTRHQSLEMLKRPCELNCKNHANRLKCCMEGCSNYYTECNQSKAYSDSCTVGESNRSNHQSRSSSKRGSKRTGRPSSSVQRKQRNPLQELNNKSARFVEYGKPSKIGLPFNNQRYRYEEDSFQSLSNPDILIHEINRFPVPLESKHYQDHETYKKRNKIVTDHSLYERDDRANYANFVYQITQDIIQNGLYTDKELQDVFKKHIELNKGVLNMNKMLLEVYQLKVSLNMFDDSELDEEAEEFIQNEKLLSVSKIRAPTPPKINEDKIIEKLMSYQTLPEVRRKSSIGTKSVVLVDANPELLLTERDVLLSLVEADVDPKLAQRICKSLFHKSRSPTLVDGIQPVEHIGEQYIQIQSNYLDSTHEESKTDEEEISVTLDDFVQKQNKDTQVNH